jgi:hypothetical protein
VGDEGGFEDAFARIDQMTPARMRPVSRNRVDWLRPFIITAAVLFFLHLILPFKLRYTPW